MKEFINILLKGSSQSRISHLIENMEINRKECTTNEEDKLYKVIIREMKAFQQELEIRVNRVNEIINS